MIASLVVGGLLLTGMVVATWYAAVRLPGDARVPLHAGSPEYSLWLSKRAGLATWLAAGAAVFAALAWLTFSQAAAGWAASMRVTLLPAVMCVALAAEVAAIILARRAVPAKTASADPSFHQLRGDTSGKSGAKVVITDRKMRGAGSAAFQPSCSASATMMPAARGGSSAVAVRGPHHRDVGPDAVEPGDAVYPPSLD